MNRSFAPFDKEGVRRAIAMGIDRSALVQATFPKGSQVATHFTPCPITDGCAGADWYEYDALAADDLLATAGFPDGFDDARTYSDTPRDYLPDPTAVAQMLADRLKADLGSTSPLKVQDLESLTADADAGRIEGLYLLGARPRYPDASYLLDGHFGSQASDQFGPQFEDVVTALDDASGTTDAAKRTKAYGEANDAIREHAPMVPLAHVGSSVAGAGRSSMGRSSRRSASIRSPRWSRAIAANTRSCRPRSRAAAIARTRPTSTRSGVCARSTSRSTVSARTMPAWSPPSRRGARRMPP